MTDVKSPSEQIDESYEEHREAFETTAALDVQVAFHNYANVYDDIMQAVLKLIYQAYSQGWTDSFKTHHAEINEIERRHSAEMMEMTERLLDRMFAPSEAGVAAK
jgi:hypothetical protein